MENILNVADYFLNLRPMTHQKLQRMCYFAQAWHLGNYGDPLVKNQFQAWVHGPVSPDLYEKYKDWGWNLIKRDPVDVTFENPDITKFLNTIYLAYKDMTDWELSAMSQRHDPWTNARINVRPGGYSTNPISWDAMKKYYSRRISETKGGKREMKTKPTEGIMLELTAYFDDGSSVTETRLMNKKSGNEALEFISNNYNAITTNWFADQQPELRDELCRFIAVPIHQTEDVYPYSIEIAAYYVTEKITF